MLDAVKKYATAILLIHLAVLAVIILIVLFAARQVQTFARDEAQVQSQERLELLADQTARGLESQYASILSDLDVILRDESAIPSSATSPNSAAAPSSASPTSPPPPATQSRGPGRGNRGIAGRGRNFAPRVDLSQPVAINVTTLSTLWRQLKGRVSQIFLVNLANQRVSLTFPESTQPAANLLSRAHIDWLRGLKDAQMSSFISNAGTQGYHLIAVPAADVGPGLLQPGPGRGGPNNDPGAPPQPPATLPGTPQFAVVVVVPIDRVREQFLDPLNAQQKHEINATLVNSEGQILAATNLKPGTNLLDQLDAVTRPKFSKLIVEEHAEPVSDVLENSFTIADVSTPPQIMASAQLEVPSGRHWTLLISSPLSETENVVNRVVHWSFLGALLLTLPITAVLVSTASFLIRGRIRLERTRHDMLTRELQQARHIQLAWLPDLKSVPAGIQVSAANLPASHISGDFYNWFPLPSLMLKTAISNPAILPASGAEHSDLPSGKIALVIGDVTGHGMAAAFLMATTQLLVRMTLSRYQDAGRCLKEVNKQLCVQAGSTFKGQFVTMLVIILDTQRNTIQVASAGHPVPLIESHGIFSPLELEPQLVLGISPDEDYHAQTFPLAPGSAMLLYTDGVIEAESPAGTQFGLQNLINRLHAQSSPTPLTPAQLTHTILQDIKRFSAHRELLDDITLLAIKTSPHKEDQA